MILPIAFRPSALIRFKACGARSKSHNGALILHGTKPFRDVEVFKHLPELLAKHFPEGAPILMYACSDGSEAWGLASALDYKLGAVQAVKYPIAASDLIPAIIDLAKTGLIKLSLEDIRHGKDIMGDKLGTYFTPAPKMDRPLGPNLLPRDFHKVEKTFKVSEVLRSRVQFSIADIRQQAWKRQEKPSVIFFRNAAYHLTPLYDNSLAKALYESLASKSLVVIGSEEDDAFASVLRNNGFRELQENPRAIRNLVFEKPSR